MHGLETWLQTRTVCPSYSGWVLIGFSVFFFIAATNTLTGWLYVMSGVVFALLTIAALLCARAFKGLEVSRRPIYPVSAGELLTVELLIRNTTKQRKVLVQVSDRLPAEIGAPVQHVIETISAKGTHYWVYQQATTRRGIYRWQRVELRSGAPLGLFWCQRSLPVNAIATVYPQVLTLDRCPLVDEVGQANSMQFSQEQRSRAANEGITRSLRIYRWGDPLRMIHWRSSARYGALRVRELEVFTSAQAVLICLDSATAWDGDAFEQAVSAAASLFFYAQRCGLRVHLWTAGSGLVQGKTEVLETLAAIQPQQVPQRLPDLPLIWLTQNSASLNQLPAGSRWLLWGQPSELPIVPGLAIQPQKSLSQQLQAMPDRF
jgi:uncharacterized protein (DUF58 family)